MIEVVIVSPFEAYIYLSIVNKSVRLTCDTGKVQILVEEFLAPLGPYVGLPLNFKLLDMDYSDTVPLHEVA
jgi:hypothetical protein